MPWNWNVFYVQFWRWFYNVLLFLPLVSNLFDVYVYVCVCFFLSFRFFFNLFLGLLIFFFFTYIRRFTKWSVWISTLCFWKNVVQLIDFVTKQSNNEAEQRNKIMLKIIEIKTEAQGEYNLFSYFRLRWKKKKSTAKRINLRIWKKKNFKLIGQNKIRTQSISLHFNHFNYNRWYFYFYSNWYMCVLLFNNMRDKFCKTIGQIV